LANRSLYCLYYKNLFNFRKQLNYNSVILSKNKYKKNESEISEQGAQLSQGNQETAALRKDDNQKGLALRSRSKYIHIIRD